MKDSLKEFINKHRADFDHHYPSARVWRSINASLRLGSSRRAWNSLSAWRAAAILFFGISAYLLVFGSGSPGKKEMANGHGEFYDVESFYEGQIAEKVAFLEDFDNAYEGDRFTQDQQKLDAMCQILREELKAKPSEKVKDAIILNMLIRVDLLNQQIKQMEDSKKKQARKESSI